MERQRILTGITTSGTPHLGNYAGAIRPAVAASLRPGVESFYFLADYHALVKVQDPARVQRSTLEIAASWLAAGLDPDKVWFYRQSDIPEIPELTWLLTCVAGKGILNRAHAYKAAVDRNQAEGLDPDAGVNAGLFMYPVLMAADILMFGAHQVPVGRDQVQHIEMARDFAARFNHLYGEHFVLPTAVIDESVATLPGLDGRKMSKSYDNTIPLFAPSAQLRKLIMGIVTDSTPPGVAKKVEDCAIFDLYRAFASAQDSAEFQQQFAAGISWGDAKQALFELLDQQLTPMREKYLSLMEHPARIEQALLEGAAKARAVSVPFLAELRHAVGLRKLDGGMVVETKRGARSEASTRVGDPPMFTLKQYRVPETKAFQFSVADADGEKVLVSADFANPKQMGEVIKALVETLGWNDRYELSVQDAADLADLVVTRRSDGQEIARTPAAMSPTRANALRDGLVAWLDEEAVRRLEKATSE